VRYGADEAQVHADASAFAEGLSKKEVYAQVLEQARILFDGQRNWVSDTLPNYTIPYSTLSRIANLLQVWYVNRHPSTRGLSKTNRIVEHAGTKRCFLTPAHSNFSNTSSLLWHALHSLPSPSHAVNWAGFYFTDPSNPSKLILGPFQGQVACQTILFNRGVCGTAAATQTTQLVADVDKFPGHIACDGASKSEIVVPIVQGGRTVAIIDVDCAELSGFDGEDQRALEELAGMLGEACDF